MEKVLLSNMIKKWDSNEWESMSKKFCNTLLKNRCICIADISLWNVEVTGYKLFQYNLSCCLRDIDDCDYVEFYIDNRDNLRSHQIRHDGTYRLLFRELKDISDSSLDTFVDKIRSGTVTSKDITRYTTSLGRYFEDCTGMTDSRE